MKKSILFICLAALLAACSGKPAATAPEETMVQPVNLILDTDLGPDYDDVGAMALMHALADSGQVNILATVSSNKDEHVVPCIEHLLQPAGYPCRCSEKRRRCFADHLA